MEFYGDEELAAMEDGLLAEHTEREQAQMTANARTEANAQMVMAPPPPVPLYDPAQVPVLGTTNGAVETPPPAGVVGFLTRKRGPMPMWAWLILGGSVAGGGYFWWRNQQEGKKGDPDEEREPRLGQRVPVTQNSPAALPESTSASGDGAWGPSRTSFAAKLQGYFDKKGLAPHVVVWHDAEDARDRGKMRIFSPLVNAQVKDVKTVKVDTALQRWARREGLDPRAHQDGSIGFYPHTGKRGKEWERYVDDLRDDGQTV